MSSIDDLAALIIQNRAALERVFESELRLVYGDRAVAQAVLLARETEQRDRMSISGTRKRRQRDATAARRAQKMFQRKGWR